MFLLCSGLKFIAWKRIQKDYRAQEKKRKLLSLSDAKLAAICERDFRVFAAGPFLFLLECLLTGLQAWPLGLRQRIPT